MTTRTRAAALAFLVSVALLVAGCSTPSEDYPSPGTCACGYHTCPLPAGTGIDGVGVIPVAPDGLPLGDEEAAEAVTPDAGEGADGHVKETADPGVGGEVFVRSPRGLVRSV